MSTLSWGKCSIQTTAVTDGAPATNAEWTNIDTPKDGTTKLTSTAGTETEALEEGGEVVDSRVAKNKVQLEFDLFRKKGGTRPWTDTDGIIAGEHAFRILGEDDSCPGIQIDRTTVSVQTSYSTADGIIDHYVAKALKPKSGTMLKEYTKTTTPGG